MDRFIVVSVTDAIKKKYPEWEEFQRRINYGDYFWCLYETDGEKPVRLVFSDGGEPEDQSLVRAWKWVPKELNELMNHLINVSSVLADRTEECVRLKKQLRELIEGE